MAKQKRTRVSFYRVWEIPPEEVNEETGEATPQDPLCIREDIPTSEYRDYINNLPEGNYILECYTKRNFQVETKTTTKIKGV